MIVKKNQVRSNLLDQADENEDGTNNDEWAASRVANCSHQLAQSILRRYQVSKPFMLKEDLKIGSMNNGKVFNSMVSGKLSVHSFHAVSTGQPVAATHSPPTWLITGDGPESKLSIQRTFNGHDSRDTERDLTN